MSILICNSKTPVAVMCIQLLADIKPGRRGRPPLASITDRRLEILKLSSGGVRSVAKQEDMCMVCEEGGGTLLRCSGPCLQLFHSKCIGLSIAPRSQTFTCDECLTGTLFYLAFTLQFNLLL